MMPFSDSNQGRIIATGFDNGIVRILMLGAREFTVLRAFKAHDTRIVKAKYSPDNSMFVTASEDGELFFFLISTENLQQYEPLCLVKIPSQTPTTITDLRWDIKSSKVLVGCSNGRVYQFEKPNPKNIDNHETYLVENLPYREWCIKMMEF
jgi:WD40 repeat protein